MRPTRRWTKGIVGAALVLVLFLWADRCLQRHTGARVAARDQSLLRVLAFDGGLSA